MHTVCTVHVYRGDCGWKGPCAVLILLSCNSLNLLMYNVELIVTAHVIVDN